MSRELTPGSTLESLKREAKRWLKALRAADPEARSRFARVHPNPPSEPTLRAVQLALAREHNLPGWTELKREVTRLELRRAGDPRQVAIRELFEASLRGDAERAGQVLDEFPDIINVLATIPGHTGRRTALHHAIGHESVVRLLLERGADPNIRDDGDDAMPLHFAAEQGDLSIVRLLLEHGADSVGEGTVHELNVLGWAICWSYVHNREVAEYLLDHGARHTIHTAVALGDVEAMEELVRRNPRHLELPMDSTNHHRRPLHLAVIKERLDSLTKLLELGADAGATDVAGLTPLDQAALDGQEQMVRLLLQHGAPIGLPAAIFLGRSGDVERLLRSEPDALSPGGRLADLIVRASERGGGETIERLIRAGASPNIRAAPAVAVDETERYTALHAAAWSGNTAAAAVLLRHGADPNVREKKYCGTPAGWAAYAGRDDTFRLISRAGIDLFQAIDFDLTDRIPEIVRQSPEMLEARFELYAPWKPIDEGVPGPWHTPLVWAIVKKKADAVRALLAAGAARVTTPDGHTLGEFARELGHEEIPGLLDT